MNNFYNVKTPGIIAAIDEKGQANLFLLFVRLKPFSFFFLRWPSYCLQ